jgi:hypothetical protein
MSTAEDFVFHAHKRQKPLIADSTAERRQTELCARETQAFGFGGSAYAETSTRETQEQELLDPGGADDPTSLARF